METWVWVLFALTMLGATGLGIWVGRRQRRTAGSRSGNDRLGVKDPRDTPWGPSSGF